MLKIIGIGNALVDILVKLDRDDLLDRFGLPKGSMQLVDQAFSRMILEESSGMETVLASGGSAANTIHGLAQLGVETAFIGSVGPDELGEFFRKDMKDHNIRARLIQGHFETGRAVVLVSPDSERTFATYLGAALEMRSDDLNEEHFQGYHILHVEGYLVQDRELIIKAMKMAKSLGLLTSFDMASYNIVEENRDFISELLTRYTDIVFANEEEARAQTGLAPEEALVELAGMCQTAVVKIGARGSLVMRGKQKVLVDAFPVKPIDTTGAGDLYAAGFLYGMASGRELEISASIGSLLASHVIEVTGSKMSPERWNQLLERISDMQ